MSLASMASGSRSRHTWACAHLLLPHAVGAFRGELDNPPALPEKPPRTPSSAMSELGGAASPVPAEAPSRPALGAGAAAEPMAH